MTEPIDMFSIIIAGEVEVFAAQQERAEKWETETEEFEEPKKRPQRLPKYNRKNRRRVREFLGDYAEYYNLAEILEELETP